MILSLRFLRFEFFETFYIIGFGATVGILPPVPSGLGDGRNYEQLQRWFYQRLRILSPSASFAMT